MNGVSLTGKVQTVLGSIEPEDLGVTMTHEHLLSSFDGLAEVPEEASQRGKYEAPFSIEILAGFIMGKVQTRTIPSWMTSRPSSLKWGCTRSSVARRWWMPRT